MEMPLPTEQKKVLIKQKKLNQFNWYHTDLISKLLNPYLFIKFVFSVYSSRTLTQIND